MWAMDPELVGPPFGDGPWEEDEPTVRSILNRVVVASVQEDPSAELAAWRSELGGALGWQWICAWAQRRVAVCVARVNGYCHSGGEVVDYVKSLVGGEGAYTERASADGLRVVYEFASGRWLAFERSGPIEVDHDAPEVREHPFAWRQLATRPADLPAVTEEEKLARTFAVPFDAKLEIECDKHKGATLAECGCVTPQEDAAARGDFRVADTMKQATEFFGRPIAPGRDIPVDECARCEERIDDGGVQTPAKTWVHFGCWAEIQKEADAFIGRSKRRYDEPAQEPGGPVFYDSSGPEPSNGWTNEPVAHGDPRVGCKVDAVPKATGSMAGGGTLKDAPAPEWEADEGEAEDLDWGDSEEEEEGGAGQAGAEVEDLVLLTACTACSRSVRMLAKHWPPPLGVVCPDCGGKVIAWPAELGRPVATADMLEPRPVQGQWRCAICSEPAYKHMTFRVGGPLSCGGCPGFEVPVPVRGSICVFCHHVHTWRLSEGVLNVCDSCGHEGGLQDYEGSHQLEVLLAQKRKAKKEEEVLPPDPDRPVCEACEAEPAAIRFTRQGKGHPVLLACRRCADKEEVRGRRRAFSEVA